jgi:hypothetical protein
MRSAACAALVLVPLVSIFACGGRFDGDLPDGGGSSGSSGGSSGVQGCPAPANVTANAACSPDGLVCPSPQPPLDCNGNPTPINCVCQSGAWVCAEPSPRGCPQPACPVPGDVRPGVGCNVQDTNTCVSVTRYYDCYGNTVDVLSCNCIAYRWTCPQPPLTCGGDASPGCPPAPDVLGGVPCSMPGLRCPGNPTQCAGQLYYDAFWCENDPPPSSSGTWVDVTPGLCAADAGAGD